MSSESLRKRLEAATPGPWEAINAKTRSDVVSGLRQTPSRYLVAKIGEPGHDQHFDADLIAHAPTDLAAALKVIERLKEFDAATTVLDAEHAGRAMIEALKEFEALP